MAENQRAKLARTIFTQYRDHCGLFWRIMLPVVIIAIALEVVVFFSSVTRVEKYIDGTFRENFYTTVGNVSTISGVYPTISLSKNVAPAEASEPDVSWQLLPIPYFTSTDNEGITWKWGLNFRSFDYGPLILLLLTLCPLSLAVAQISRGSALKESVPLTARGIWKQTRQRFLAVLGASLLFVLIVDIAPYVHAIIGMAISWVSEVYQPLYRVSDWMSHPYVFFIFLLLSCYFLVTLSLYNPCLILENNSIIGVFRRSHTLVSGARLRFFGVYFLTGWIASVVTSVLLGAVLLVFSIFISELGPVRDAFSPLRFLTLFIGGDIEVILPKLLSTPVVIGILIVKGLIATFLVPIWAILTTHLYLERADAVKEAIEP